MQKRLFCALWMAGFANVPGIPFLIFAIAKGAEAGFVLPIVLTLALVGAVVGGLVQPFAIGRHSNALLAAIMGAFSAALAVPLLGLFLMLIDHPPSFTNLAGVLYFAERWFHGLLNVHGEIWLIITPAGALAGSTLQWAWLSRERRQATNVESKDR